ncbi:glutathione S-transferase family protein [Hahella sp. KA22]|uniref:glutathione S-transferase family protein n=1 Tax=Hahella sp. KA22 TaxID=1628392 RepID=UPI000FDF10E2|nr:glutathione S-transferase family protein [Hahella sp. KA22]AZZ92148.1 glutathione S-transferase family protein [Hahella sp. KA22]QAY55519.1 glutathione S-transferase family protein [Hahella sp. KA22]
MSIGTIELVSFKLCPYVQRSVITLLEKGVVFKRTDIDLANKPGWFLALSPTGKVPLLLIDNKDAIFESAVICEYLDEVTEGSLFPADPKSRALHRSWIEFGSQTLDAIGRYYSAQDKESFSKAEELLRRRFERLEDVIVGPYFSGTNFMIVDAVYAPVFRYFDVFNSLIKIDLFKGLAKVEAWRRQLAARQSVIDAVDADFAEALIAFVIRKQSYLSHLLQSSKPA